MSTPKLTLRKFKIGDIAKPIMGAYEDIEGVVVDILPSITSGKIRYSIEFPDHQVRFFVSTDLEKVGE